MSEILSTDFYTVSKTEGVTGHRGEIIEAPIYFDERLIARKGPNGKFAIRSNYADTDFNGPGGSMHPFNAVRRLADWWGNYTDYEFTRDEVEEQFASFKGKYSRNGSRFSS